MNMRVALMLLALGSLTACPPDEPECSADKPCDDGETCVDGTCTPWVGQKYDLNFTGNSFTANIGKTLRVAVLDLDASNAVVKTDSQSVGSAGSFGFTWPDLLTGSHRYQVHYYVDMNGDSTCTAASDHAWQESVAVVSADVTLNVTRRSAFDDVCATFTPASDGGAQDAYTPPPWDLTITGTGFGARGLTNPGYAQLLDDQDTAIGAVVSTTVVDGFFTFTWSNVLQPSVFYVVRFYLDLDSDGTCELNEGGYEVDVGVVVGDQELPLVGSMQQTQVCATFNTPADAGVPDSAVTTDTGTPVDATAVEDASAVDAGVAEDASVVEDAAAFEDATSAEDATAEDA